MRRTFIRDEAGVALGLAIMVVVVTDVTEWEQYRASLHRDAGEPLG